MTDLERLIYNACYEADTAFGVDGAGGTKTWIRDYFFPSLGKHGLTIVPTPVIEAAKSKDADLGAFVRGLMCTYGVMHHDRLPPDALYKIERFIEKQKEE